MFQETLRKAAFKAFEFTFRPMAERKYEGGWNGFLFDARAENLANRYMKGEIDLNQAHSLIDKINETGRYPGRDMREGFGKWRKEIAERIAPPSVPESRRREPSD